mgnify:CR=1 FL=1
MAIKIASKPRKGLKDIWNAFMVKGAVFSSNGIPFCPNTTDQVPDSIITYEEAVQIYNHEMKRNNKIFHSKSFVCFFIDDYKFDNTRGIWSRWKQAKRVLEHFDGIISPDFSTYQDFPLPLKLVATYKMRAFGYWWGSMGHKVINNVRGDVQSFDYCFDGIPLNGIVCIGTVASGLRKIENRQHFFQWFEKMVATLKPHTILVYGSAKYSCFEKAKQAGIKIIEYPSKTSTAFKTTKEVNNE